MSTCLSDQICIFVASLRRARRQQVSPAAIKIANWMHLRAEKNKARASQARLFAQSVWETRAKRRRKLFCLRLASAEPTLLSPTLWPASKRAASAADGAQWSARLLDAGGRRLRVQSCGQSGCSLLLAVGVVVQIVCRRTNARCEPGAQLWVLVEQQIDQSARPVLARPAGLQLARREQS